jgi:CheY-like chemotaxis protein
MEANSVFVVEDDAPVRAVMVEALERSGYRVWGFGDGASALRRLDEIFPDLILLDMRMPEMDGFEFLSRLRANPAWGYVPVIIVSGLGEDLLKAIDAGSAQALGVAGLFAKPFDIPTLLRYVAGIITRSPALRPSQQTAL